MENEAELTEGERVRFAALLRERARRAAAARPTHQGSCVQCGAKIEGIAIRRYCSVKCRLAASRTRRGFLPPSVPAPSPKPAEQPHPAAFIAPSPHEPAEEPSYDESQEYTRERIEDEPANEFSPRYQAPPVVRRTAKR